MSTKTSNLPQYKTTVGKYGKIPSESYDPSVTDASKMLSPETSPLVIYASDPVVPEDDGTESKWELVTSAVTHSNIFWFWKRVDSTTSDKLDSIIQLLAQLSRERGTPG